MTIKIGCIVEGHSEVETVPLLIRRIAANLYPELPIVVPPPICRPRNKVKNIVYYTHFTYGMEG